MRSPAWLLPALIFATVFAATLLHAPRMGDGWLWELPQALGFAAFAGLLVLQFETGVGRGVQPHEQLSWWVLALVAGHVAFLLLTDATTVEYLKLKSPPYMLAGIAATLLLLVLLGLAVLRRTAFSSRKSFGRWHWWLSWAVLGLTAHHVLGSGFYLGLPLEGVLLVAVLGTGVVAVMALAHRHGRAARFSLAPVVITAAALIAVFVVVRLD